MGHRDPEDFMASRSAATSERRQSVTSRKTMAESLMLLLVFLVCISLVSGDPDVTFQYGWCSNARISDQSTFYDNLDTLLHNLLAAIDINTGRWHTQSDYNDDTNTVYGLATCNVGYDDCKACLEYIITDNLYLNVCPPDAYGGQVMLTSCFLEYENYYIE